MATVDVAAEYGGTLQGIPSGAPPARRMGRHSSIVLHETKQLLDGLYGDHSRSRALMAELEGLLSSSHGTQAVKLETTTNVANGNATSASVANAPAETAPAQPKERLVDAPSTSDAAPANQPSAPASSTAAAPTRDAKAAAAAQNDSDAARVEMAPRPPAAARRAANGMSSSSFRRKSDTYMLMQHHHALQDSSSMASPDFVVVPPMYDGTGTEDADYNASSPTARAHTPAAARSRRSSTLILNSPSPLSGTSANTLSLSGPIALASPPAAPSSPAAATATPAGRPSTSALTRTSSFVRPGTRTGLMQVGGKSFTEGAGAGAAGGAGRSPSRCMSRRNRSRLEPAAAATAAASGLSSPSQQLSSALGGGGVGGIGLASRSSGNGMSAEAAEAAAGCGTAVGDPSGSAAAAAVGGAAAASPTAVAVVGPSPPVPPPQLGPDGGSCEPAASMVAHPGVAFLLGGDPPHPGMARRPSLRVIPGAAIASAASPLGPQLTPTPPPPTVLSPAGAVGMSSGGQQRYDLLMMTEGLHEPVDEGGWPGLGSGGLAGGGMRPLSQAGLRSRSGRFMRMLKGVFQSQPDSAATAASSPSSPGASPGPGGSGGGGGPEGDLAWECMSPGGGPAMGALSGMVLVAQSSTSFSSGIAGRPATRQQHHTSAPFPAAVAASALAQRSLGAGGGGGGSFSRRGSALGYVVGGGDALSGARASSGPVPRVLV
ncbi:hypothetical protein Agub_g3198, partial [Astrephomene gubernaculifera]